MPSLPELVEARASGSEQAVSNEAHVVGEDSKLPGTNYVLLNEVPLESTGVTISGFTEVTGTPASGEFRAFYPPDLWAGLLEFHSSAIGSSIQASYDGTGSTPAATWHNRARNRLQGETVLTSAATIVLPLETAAGAGHRQFYAPLSHAAEFQLPATVPVGVTFDLLIANNITGNGGPFTPTYAAADFDFGDAGAPTLPTVADEFHWLGFGVRGNIARFFGIQTGFTI